MSLRQRRDRARRNNSLMKQADQWLGPLVGLPLSRLTAAAGRPPPLPGVFKRILAFKFCCMGDAVLVLPALCALKERYPEAELTVLCTPRTVEIFADCPEVDRLLLFKLSGQRGPGEYLLSAARYLLGTLRQLRAGRYDLCVDFDNYYNFTTILGFLSGAPVRVGFDPPGQGRGHLLTHPVPYVGNRHMVEFYLDLVRAVGAEAVEKTPRLSVAEADDVWARGFLEGMPSSLVAISPGRSGAWHFIRWPEERFVEVASALQDSAGAGIVLIGGRAEIPIARRMMGALADRGVPAWDAVGRCTLGQTKALLARCALHVCNDCGPMHISAALGVPTLAIFGPANPWRWGPYGPLHRFLRLDLPCSPCLFMGAMNACSHYSCLKLSSRTVAEAALEMLEERTLAFGKGAVNRPPAGRRGASRRRAPR